VTPIRPQFPAQLEPQPIPGLEDDPEGSRIVSEELKLLSTVQQALESADRADVSAIRDRGLDEERMLELRDHVAVAKPEDLPALFEQMHHLGALRAQRGRGVQSSVDRSSPYFGHMRLDEEVASVESSGRARREPRGDGSTPRGRRGALRRRDVLIGARSYLGDGIRIVDWRHAPVSRIYYRYAEGDEYEEELGDRIVEGTVVARRGVRIVNGELVRVAAPQGTFVRNEEGIWKRAHVRTARLETEKTWTARLGAPAAARLGIGADGQLRSDKHLPSIAALLDERQYELIAREPTGLVAVQGSAGSGKTTVGLHRIAYLVFLNPQRFRPEKMFVVVPNDALVHYVARVLPSLGVEGVPVATFGRFAARMVGHLLPRLPSRINDTTPPVVSRVKSHPAMLRAIDAAGARLTAEADARLRSAMTRWPQGDRVIDAWMRTSASRDAIERSSVPLDARLAALTQWLGGRHAPGGSHSTDLPQVTRSAAEQLAGDLRATSRSVLRMWDEILTSRQALADAFGPEPAVGPSQLDQVHAWCVRQSRVRSEGNRDGEEPTLDTEDLALLLRCWQVLRGALVDPGGKAIRFAHLFVDEVQDASPIELRVLLDLTGTDRCITLAGDTAQRMLDEGDERGEFDWNALLDHLGMAHTRIEPLRVSYRSTAEITAFARRVLGPLAHDEVPVTTREGPPVELFQLGSAGEAVAWLAEVLKQLALDEPDANVALVARFPQQADVYFEGLVRAEVPAVRRVAKQDFSWEAGVDVTDIRQTKGLEFDEVVLLETTAAAYPATPHARHALYVGATRASHQLWCISSGSASSLVLGALDPVTPGPGSPVTPEPGQ
jgi:DNA helicase II / ATP-dependent DNA helicase PcrA